MSGDALVVAEQAARAAGEVLREGFGASSAALIGRRQRSESKSSAIDLVTVYDRRAEDLIVGRLREAFPDDVIIAEEGGLRAPAVTSPGRSRWLVDPLDGTTNFSHGLPFYCVSIGRETDGRVDLAVVHAPSLNLHYTATRGGGAFLNGARVHVSDTAVLAESMLATGFPYDRHTSAENNFDQFIAFQKRAQAVRRYGSAALDLCLVASGTYDGYWEMKLKPWDVAAGALLVEEAGGRVTGWQGEAHSCDHGAALASNGLIHEVMLRVLADTGIPGAARR